MFFQHDCIQKAGGLRLKFSFIWFASKIKAKILLCIEGNEMLPPFDAKQNGLLHVFFSQKYINRQVIKLEKEKECLRVVDA